MENINLDLNECPICFNQMNLENKYITNCNHEYCMECLDKWFDKGKNSCPKCRGLVKYLNNDNIRIRFISVNKPIVIQRNNLPPNTTVINKNLLHLLLLGYLLTTFSIGINIYFINNYDVGL